MQPLIDEAANYQIKLEHSDRWEKSIVEINWLHLQETSVSGTIPQH